MAVATIGQVRLLVNDIAPNDVFADQHYTDIIAIESNVYKAAALAANTLSAYYATKIETTVGPVSIKNQQKFEHYSELADKYDKRAASNKDDSFASLGGGAPVTTGIINSEIDTVHEDDDRYKSAFYRGVTDNPTGSDSIVDPYNGDI